MFWESASGITRAVALRPALEHVEHPVGHEEAADHVHRPEDDRDEREDLLERRVGGAGDDHRADEDDPVDRVRPRHERRVQERRHAADQLEAEQRGEREDREAGDELGGSCGDLLQDACRRG